MDKERLWHADVVRIVACIMVVFMHSPMPGDNLIPVFASALTYFSMPCIGLFFTLSGYLLMPIKATPSDSFMWSVKRVNKFLWPLLIWTFVYLLVRGTFISGDIGQIIRVLCSIPFSPQEGVLWFMYVLIGLYIVAPIISPWLQEIDKKSLRRYLGIWGFSLLIPYITPLVGIRVGMYGMFYYVSGFLGYFLLGYYLRKYDIRIKVWISILGIGSCMGIYAIYKVMLEDKGWNFGDVFSYLSIDNLLLFYQVLHHIFVVLLLIEIDKLNIQDLNKVDSLLCFFLFLILFLFLRNFVL